MEGTFVVTPVADELEAVQRFHSQMTYPWIVICDGRTPCDTYNWLLTRAHCLSCDTRGLAYAYRTGLKHALTFDPEFIIEMDIGHPVQHIPEIIERLRHVPCVFGRRASTTASYKRRLLSWLGTCAARLILDCPQSDATSGYEGFQAWVVEELVDNLGVTRGHMFQTEVKNLCRNLLFSEFDFHYEASESHLTGIWEAIKTLYALRDLPAISMPRPKGVLLAIEEVLKSGWKQSPEFVHLLGELHEHFSKQNR